MQLWYLLELEKALLIQQIDFLSLQFPYDEQLRTERDDVVKMSERARWKTSENFTKLMWRNCESARDDNKLRLWVRTQFIEMWEEFWVLEIDFHRENSSENFN